VEVFGEDRLEASIEKYQAGSSWRKFQRPALEASAALGRQGEH
jgi:hypothetical protein